MSFGTPAIIYADFVAGVYGINGQRVTFAELWNTAIVPDGAGLPIAAPDVAVTSTRAFEAIYNLIMANGGDFAMVLEFSVDAAPTALGQYGVLNWDMGPAGTWLEGYSYDAGDYVAAIWLPNYPGPFTVTGGAVNDFPLKTQSAFTVNGGAVLGFANSNAYEAESSPDIGDLTGQIAGSVILGQSWGVGIGRPGAMHIQFLAIYPPGPASSASDDAEAASVNGVRPNTPFAPPAGGLAFNGNPIPMPLPNVPCCMTAAPCLCQHP